MAYHVSIVADRYPHGGELTIGLMGFVGMLGSSVWIPRIGMLSNTYGLIGALKIVSFLPIIVFVIFAIWWIKIKRTGGYKPINLVKEMKATRK